MKRNVSQQQVLATKVANSTLGCMSNCCQQDEGWSLPLAPALVRVLLEYNAQLRAPHTDTDVMGCVQ